MNRQTPNQTVRRAARSSAGFTPQQAMILFIVAVLGFSALGLAAYLLFFQTPAPSQAMLPATQIATIQAAGTEEPGTHTPEAPTLPAACLQQNGGILHGKTARVINGSTIEAQVDGITQQFTFAGIQLPGASPLSEQAVAATSALIDGQDILFVQDPQAADAGGAPLPRYILLGEQFLNLDLVRQGLAQTDPNALEQACANVFLQAEQQARAEKIGLWQPKRVPTATFLPFVTLDPALSAPCDCISRPVCSDFRTHDEAQACYNACNDYNSKLDDDRDGIACEGLP